MSPPKPLPLRSTTTTLLSGSTSFSQRLICELSVRKSLVGHWTLIDPLTHKPVYYVSPPSADSSRREVRRLSCDGSPVAEITLKTAPSECSIALLEDSSTLELKRTFRGRHRFVLNGKVLYWKRDAICRESLTRRMYAETDGDVLLIYEAGELLLDALVASYIAVRFKQDQSRLKRWFGVKVSFASCLLVKRLTG